MGTFETGVVHDREDVAGHLCSRVRPRRSFAAADSAVVDEHDVEALREPIGHGLPSPPRVAEAVHEHDRPTRAAPLPCDPDVHGETSPSSRPARDEQPDPRRQAGEPSGHEEDDSHEQRTEEEEGLGERDTEDVRQVLDPLLTRDGAQPVVEQGVEEPADHCAEARPGASENDHHEKRERERRGCHLGSHSDQQEPHESAPGGEERREDERDELVGIRTQPDHLDAALVVSDCVPDVPGGRPDRDPGDEEHCRRVDERDPVQVLRVDDADEEVGKRIEVQGEPLVTPGQAPRVGLDDDVPCLRERKRDHRESDTTHPQAHGAQHERYDECDPEQKTERCGQPPIPLAQCDRGHVDPECEVERVPERQQARESEEEVVGQRNPCEGQAQSEQLERPG